METDALSAGTMAVHMLLSASSLIFKVPKKRIPKNPTMIWQEYKLHAIAFTARCVVVYGIGAAVAQGMVLSQLQRLLLVLAMHVVADIISWWVGQDGNTTVRGNGKAKMPIVQRLSLVYASYQFFALGSHLIPHARTMDLGYNTLIAIQSSAFAMTLNRKGLISWRGHALIYGACLAVSFGFIMAQMRSALFVAAVLAVFGLRVKARVSKYVLWSAFALAWPALLQLSGQAAAPQGHAGLETDILGNLSMGSIVSTYGAALDTVSSAGGAALDTVSSAIRQSF